jgi:hypothetical protein
MKLYDYFRSSAAYRVRIALAMKGIVPDDRTFVHLRAGNQRAQDYLALNPQGLVPALALDDGEVLTSCTRRRRCCRATRWPGPACAPSRCRSPARSIRSTTCACSTT